MKSTTTGSDWRPLADLGIMPTALTSSEDATMILAATTDGVLRSKDAGRTWTSLTGTPPIMLLDWVSTDVIIGITVAGDLSISADHGATWEVSGSVKTAPQAITADMKPNGKLRILVATSTDLLESTDDGFTFTPIPHP